MQAIGVRELKEHASEILRRVRDEGAMFEVTYHGRVIARLVPVTRSEVDRNLSSFWDQWDALAHAISARWPEGVSAVDAVREGRRDL